MIAQVDRNDRTLVPWSVHNNDGGSFELVLLNIVRLLSDLLGGVMTPPYRERSP